MVSRATVENNSSDLSSAMVLRTDDTDVCDLTKSRHSILNCLNLLNIDSFPVERRYLQIVTLLGNYITLVKIRDICICCICCMQANHKGKMDPITIPACSTI